jgi:hypothetical protein
VGRHQRAPPLVVGGGRHHDGVGRRGQRAGAPRQDRAARAPTTWSRAGYDLQPGRLGLGTRLPAPARRLHEHPRAVGVVAGGATRRPHRRVPGGPDDEPHGDPVIRPQRRVPPRPQHVEHALVGDQHVGFEVGNAPGVRRLHEGVEQVRAQPATLVGRHRDGELAVAVGQRLVVRLPHDPSAGGGGVALTTVPVADFAVGVHCGDHPVPATVDHGGNALEERARGAESGEEALVAVVVGQPVVQRGEAIDVGGADRSHGQLPATGQRYAASPEVVRSGRHRAIIDQSCRRGQGRTSPTCAEGPGHPPTPTRGPSALTPPEPAAHTEPMAAPATRGCRVTKRRDDDGTAR